MGSKWKDAEHGAVKLLLGKLAPGALGHRDGKGLGHLTCFFAPLHHACTPMVRAFALPLLKPWQGAPPITALFCSFSLKCDQTPPFSVTQRTSHLHGPSYSAQQVPLPLHLQRVCPLAKKKDEKTITDFTSGCQCCCKTQQRGVSRHFPSLRYKQCITAANRTKRFFFRLTPSLRYSILAWMIKL